MTGKLIYMIFKEHLRKALNKMNYLNWRVNENYIAGFQGIRFIRRTPSAKIILLEKRYHELFFYDLNEFFTIPISVFIIILLPRHFTIFGQKNAQKMSP